MRAKPLKKTITYTKFLPLKQRISVAYHISPLSKSDAYAYFDHHLALAKAPAKVFMDNAVETILTSAKGIPRTINTLAFKALNHAVVDMKMTIVDQECVME